MFHVSRVLFGSDRESAGSNTSPGSAWGAGPSGVRSTNLTETITNAVVCRAPDTFAAQWFGYVAVARSGSFTFALTSDDAAFLSVDVAG